MKQTDYHSWEFKKDQLLTRWANNIDPKNPYPKYPRPQLKRKDWMNLNGLWDYAILPKNQGFLSNYEGKILVPFAVESALSGVKRILKPNQKLWYRRKFIIPESWKGKKIILHFGAVDWETTIWVDMKLVGVHKGGYTPFHFDISEFLESSKENELLVSVWDPTDKGHQEHGKQSLHPKIILYTAVSGIWQTVWLEPVPETHIDGLKMVPDIDTEILNIELGVMNLKPNDIIRTIVVDENNQNIVKNETFENEFSLNIKSPKLWSPDSPYLYKIIFEIIRNDSVIDKVESYFGMRKISLSKDGDGIKRIALNNEYLFQLGTLDQGYWPDGLYTAPTDDALRYDIEITKELGFNMIRKHVKVEPARWYYYCDKLGILVWQDMPNGERWSIANHIKMKLSSEKRYKGKRKKDVKKNYYDELEAMIKLTYNSPSVIVWVPFNEGWGQFETEKVTDKIRNLDPSRLINSASGWFDKGVGDIRDIHNYPDPKMPNNLKGRAAVVGEFGGLGLEIKGHMWDFKRKFVYRNFPDPEKLLKKYEKLISSVRYLIEKGLSAAIYTQITDVEQEVNGLMTYDREIIKMDKNKLRGLNESVFRSYTFPLLN